MGVAIVIPVGSRARAGVDSDWAFSQPVPSKKGLSGEINSSISSMTPSCSVRLGGPKLDHDLAAIDQAQAHHRGEIPSSEELLLRRTSEMKHAPVAHKLGIEARDTRRHPFMLADWLPDR
jgi:hypothetical protein